MIYHGNSWRLAAELDRETEVLGSPAWLSTLPDGSALVDLRVPPGLEPCDYWAVRGIGVSAEDLLAATQSMRLNPSAGVSRG